MYYINLQFSQLVWGSQRLAASLHAQLVHPQELKVTEDKNPLQLLYAQARDLQGEQLRWQPKLLHKVQRPTPQVQEATQLLQVAMKLESRQRLQPGQQRPAAGTQAAECNSAVPPQAPQALAVAKIPCMVHSCSERLHREPHRRCGQPRTRTTACHMWQQRPAWSRRAYMAALWGQSAVLSRGQSLTKVHQCLGLDRAVKLHAFYCQLLH